MVAGDPIVTTPAEEGVMDVNMDGGTATILLLLAGVAIRSALTAPVAMYMITNA